jgi:hypothetical protein
MLKQLARELKQLPSKECSPRFKKSDLYKQLHWLTSSVVLCRNPVVCGKQETTLASTLNATPQHQPCRHPELSRLRRCARRGVASARAKAATPAVRTTVPDADALPLPTPSRFACSSSCSCAS